MTDNRQHQPGRQKKKTRQSTAGRRRNDRCSFRVQLQIGQKERNWARKVHQSEDSAFCVVAARTIINTRHGLRVQQVVTIQMETTASRATSATANRTGRGPFRYIRKRTKERRIRHKKAGNNTCRSSNCPRSWHPFIYAPFNSSYQHVGSYRERYAAAPA